MLKSESKRRIHESMLPHYKPFYRGTRCYYCGDLASTIDHVPAISVAYSFGRDYFDKKRIKLITVSSCRECNSLLGSKPLNTLTARTRYLYEKLQNRYDKYLKMVDWDQDEIEQLTGWLRDYVQQQGNFKDYMERRFQYMEDLHEDII